MLVLTVSSTDLHVGGGGVSYWLTCWWWPWQLLTYMLVLAVSATDLHVGGGGVSY